MKKYLLSSIVCVALLNAASIDEDLAGFDDAPTTATPQAPTEETDELMAGFDDAVTTVAIDSNDTCLTKPIEEPQSTNPVEGLTGELKAEYAYAPNTKKPHDKSSSLKTSLFLDYEHKFENGIRVKVNGKAYYDFMYGIKGEEKFTTSELDELQSEVELFDAYIQGSILDNLDYKVGRQVVVWGRSETIRITDVLNPLDNRRPGMVDIEDLRLPVAMAKFDYFIDNWRITPIAVLEQRFSKLPPAGGAFNSMPFIPQNEEYSDVTYALSIGAEFEGWDVNFYASKLRDDLGAFNGKTIEHKKVPMVGAALNYLTGSWLFKAEVAHFKELAYTTVPNQTFSRTDGLVGFEYEGFSDTSVSYDFSLRSIDEYDKRLFGEFIPLQEKTYQHALRISSEFMNARLMANYVVSLYGKSLDEGGFQRLWFEYDLADGWATSFGAVDYIGGSTYFDSFKDNDLLFTNVSYSF